MPGVQPVAGVPAPAHAYGLSEQRRVTGYSSPERRTSAVAGWSRVRDSSTAWDGDKYASAPGYTRTARATDGEGHLQVEQFNLPQPDGGAGWDSIQVTAV